MLTRKIDEALDAIMVCRARVPFLRDLNRRETPQWEALDNLMSSLERADAVLLGPHRAKPEER